MSIYVEKSTRKGITEEAAEALKGQGKVFVYPDDVDPKVIKADLDIWEANQEEASFQNRDGALGRGIQQGVSLGFADEIAGGIVAGIEGVKSVFDDRPIIDTIKNTYTDVRDSERSKLERDRELNPNTAMVGSIAGSLVPSPAMAGKVIQGAKGLAGAVAKGSATGAVMGAGYSEGETLGEVARDTAIGGVMGAAVPVAVKGATMGAVKATRGAGEALKRSGEKLQKGKIVTEVRRNQNKLNDDISTLTTKRQDLIDEKAVLKSSGANKTAISSVDRKLGNIDKTIKVKERQILREQGRIDPKIAVKQGILDKVVNTPTDNTGSRATIQAIKQELKAGLDDTLTNVALRNKFIDKVDDIVDFSSILGVGIATGNPIISTAAAIGKKAVLDKFLKRLGINLNVGEMTINQFNNLKSFIGGASKLSGGALTKMTKGITDIADKIPAAYKPAFEQALATGGVTAGVYHYYLLTTDPKYRKAMQEVVNKEGKSLMFNAKSNKGSKQ